MIIHSAFTRGLERDLLFYGDADFLYGMNIIPRYLKLSGIRLLAFCLMDNHVHFVLEGCRAGCNQFIINYKRTLLSFLKKCRERVIPETTVPGTVGIEGTDRLLTVIAYVLRNPVAAGINYLPQDYKWGSASTYFRKRCNMYGKAANEAYGTARGIMGSTEGSDTRSTAGSDTRSTAVCCTLAVKNSDIRSMTDNNAPTDKCMHRKIEELPHREETLLHRRPGISWTLDSRRQRHDISGKLHRSG